MNAYGRMADNLQQRLHNGVDQLKAPKLSLYRTAAEIATVANAFGRTEDIEGLGYFGMMDTPNGFFSDVFDMEPEMHIWVGRATPEELRFVVAHELGHYAMRKLGQAGEEVMADGYGWVEKTTEDILAQIQQRRAVP